MEIRTDAKYQFSDRFKGEYSLEIFNHHYLCTTHKRLKKERQFKMEVAVLNPKAKKRQGFPWRWLATALLSLAASAYLINNLLGTVEGSSYWAVLGGAGALALLGAGSLAAFWLGIDRKWVFQTRTADYPLVIIPFNKSSKKEAEQFAQRLSIAIESTNLHKGYSEEDLRAGELRMMRRLSKSGFISEDKYNSAKKRLLSTGGQGTAAAA